MGASGSREIVLPGSPAALPGAGADEATRKRADESFRSACVPQGASLPPPSLLPHASAPPLSAHISETTIYQEGYRQGASEAHARLTEGAQLAVKAAISRTLVEREGSREQELEEAIAALRKSQYRCAAPQPALILACSAGTTWTHSLTLSFTLPSRTPKSVLQSAAETARVPGRGGSCAGLPRSIRLRPHNRLIRQVRPQRRGFPHEPKAGVSDLMYFLSPPGRPISCVIFIQQYLVLYGKGARKEEEEEEEEDKKQEACTLPKGAGALGGVHARPSGRGGKVTARAHLHGREARGGGQVEG